jgi:hypothetical protein
VPLVYSSAVVIRTVLDARPSSPRRFQLQTLILAHSWDRWARTVPLDVLVVGKAPAPVEERLKELGATVLPCPTHLLNDLSPSSNKLGALKEPSDGPVLLVDNDTCIIEDLSGMEGRSVRSTICGRARVSDEQWKHIRRATGLEPIRREWVSLQSELKAKRAGGTPKVEERLYFASGVSWFREPADFEPLWSDGIARIAKAFQGHPLENFAVHGCDQAGFAVAVAQTGGLDLLPPTYNHRPMCFRLGLRDPQILHLGELGALKSGMMPFSELLTTWWERRILKPIRQLGSDGAVWPSHQEEARLLDEAVGLRDRVLALGRDAGLDAFDFSGPA